MVEDVRILELPVVGAIETGRWTFTGQLAYEWTSASVNGIGYGAMAGFAATDSLELMAEIYGAEFSGDEVDEGFTNWRWAWAGGYLAV